MKFEELTKKTDCIIWQGHITTLGYGVFFENDESNFVHRIAYQKEYGDIPDGLVIDHLCRNRICVNPKHLQAVTQKENLERRPNFKTSPLIIGGNIQLVHLAKNCCNKGHKLKTLTVSKDGDSYKARCQDCLIHTAKIEMKKESEVNVKQFIEEYKKVYPQHYLNSIKQMLKEQGMNTYGKTYISSRKFLDKALEMKTFRPEDLALELGLEVKHRRLRKDPGDLPSLQEVNPLKPVDDT